MRDFIAGFFAPWLVYALILALHLSLPARKVAGYVRDRENTGKPLKYRLNGPLVLLIAVGLWALAGRLQLLPWDWLYRHRWSGLAGSCALGLIFSFAVVAPAKSTGRSFLAELYLGRLENPQYFRGRVDAKMFLYLAGAAMLTLNILSFFAHHLSIFGVSSSPGVSLYCFLFSWFVVDYLVFERVHLYTYDFVAERVGFKLGWGCLTFYPYFYAVGLWAAAELPDPRTVSWLLIAYGCVFFAGWILSRGANMQKYLFKTDPERELLGILKSKALTDGKRSLLCSGFWGVSRHVNYLGELLMATGLTLALGWPSLWVVWLYPLYYVALLFPRERADERRCAAKYGALWDEYVRRVPKRIIPGLY
jgi:protein-S-isoprenylcysteine O-methyltransferase Ste14